MSKILVVYQSKYGATQKYAQWLSEELSCDFIEIKKVIISKIEKYDTVIVGSGIYETGLAALSFLSKNYQLLKHKTIVLFAVGASPNTESTLFDIKNRILKNTLPNIPFYYLRGTWNENKMSLKDKTLCKMLKKVLSKKDPINYEPWQSALVQSVGTYQDWTKKENINPIIEFLNK